MAIPTAIQKLRDSLDSEESANESIRCISQCKSLIIILFFIISLLAAFEIRYEKNHVCAV
jgi:hypothetical protein